MNNDHRPDLSIVTHPSDRTNPLSDSAEVMKADDSPLFYWELTGTEYDNAYPQALEDEGYLANDLIVGANLLATPGHHEPCPPRIHLPSPDADSAVYSDAIAAILQVAAWNGHDVDEITDEALGRQQSTYEWSASAAHHRPRDAHPVER